MFVLISTFSEISGILLIEHLLRQQDCHKLVRVRQEATLELNLVGILKMILWFKRYLQEGPQP